MSGLVLVILKHQNKKLNEKYKRNWQIMNIENELNKPVFRTDRGNVIIVIPKDDPDYEEKIKKIKETGRL